MPYAQPPFILNLEEVPIVGLRADDPTDHMAREVSLPSHYNEWRI